MPPLAFRDTVLDLEEGKGDAEDHRPDHDDAQQLGDELADVTPEQALDALAVRTVPPGAVLAVGEEADAQHAERAVDAVHGDGTDRIVDLQSALDEEHRLDDEDPCEEPITADMAGVTKAHGAVIATSPASMPLTIMPGSGLPTRRVIHSMATTAPKAPAMAVFAGDRGELDIGRREGRRGVEAEPAEQQDERAELAIGMLWPGSARGLPSGPYLPIRGPSTTAPANAATPPTAWTTPRAGEVDVAGPQAHRVPRLGQPAAAPGPCGEERVVDGAAEQTPDDEAPPLPPLGHGTRRNRGDSVHEGDHVQEEGEDAGRDRTADMHPPFHRKAQLPLPSRSPRTATLWGRTRQPSS